MAIDAFSAARPHVTITFQPLPGTNPGAGPHVPHLDQHAGAAAALREKEHATVQAFAVAMSEQMVSAPAVSTAQMIARKLPGSPQNVYAQMQAIREENELVSERREIARKMAQKEDEITYRD